MKVFIFAAILVSLASSQVMARSNLTLKQRASLLIELAERPLPGMDVEAQRAIKSILEGQDVSPSFNLITGFVCKEIGDVAGANRECRLSILNRDFSGAADSSTTVRFRAEVFENGFATVSEIIDIDFAG